MEALERRLASAEASATGVSVVGTNNSSLVGAPTTGSGGGGNSGVGNNSHLHHHRSHHSGRSRSATTSEAEEDEEDEEEEEEDVGMDSTEENDLDLKPLRPPRTKHGGGGHNRPKVSAGDSVSVVVEGGGGKEEVKEIDGTVSDPLYEEDIIEGFSFAAFKSYEDLEVRHEKIKWRNGGNNNEGLTSETNPSARPSVRRHSSPPAARGIKCQREARNREGEEDRIRRFLLLSLPLFSRKCIFSLALNLPTLCLPSLVRSCPTLLQTRPRRDYRPLLPFSSPPLQLATRKKECVVVEARGP